VCFSREINPLGLKSPSLDQERLAFQGDQPLGPEVALSRSREDGVLPDKLPGSVYVSPSKHRGSPSYSTNSKKPKEDIKNFLGIWSKDPSRRCLIGMDGLLALLTFTFYSMVFGPLAMNYVMAERAK
jgi:hypothetical protein